MFKDMQTWKLIRKRDDLREQLAVVYEKLAIERCRTKFPGFSSKCKNRFRCLDGALSLDTNVFALPLTNSVRQRLDENGIKTLRDLLQTTAVERKKIRNFGARSEFEVKLMLSYFHFKTQ